MEFDQLTIKKNLISIYTNPLKEITDEKIVSVFFPGESLSEENVQKRKEELSNINTYLKTKQILEECRKNIEDSVFDGETIGEENEVKAVLFKVVLNRAIYFSFKLDETRFNYQMNILNDLIVAIFITSKKWTEKISNHYYFVSPFLKDWYSFFLSYTNKSAFSLNQQFESLLKLPTVSSKINQVARFIAETLRDRENVPNGFIDEKEIEYGEDFKAKINSALKKSFTFVQIVSKETFLLQGNNWCQFEYEGYKKIYNDTFKKPDNSYASVFGKNIIFLVMGENLDKVRPFIDFREYREWLKDIESTHHMTLYATNQNYETLINNINALAKTIINLKNDLINAIPN
jgi:hypothetical protein